MKIGNREVIIKEPEETRDYAELLADLITGGDYEKYVANILQGQAVKAV